MWPSRPLYHPGPAPEPTPRPPPPSSRALWKGRVTEAEPEVPDFLLTPCDVSKLGRHRTRLLGSVEPSALTPPGFLPL